jgi:hypothetical protein
MTFFDEINSIFSQYNPDDYSDEELEHEFQILFNNEIAYYTNYFDSFKKIIEEKYELKIRKLIEMRVFASEIWDHVFKNYDEAQYNNLKYRISAIGKIYHRVLISTDENIILLRNGVGISVLSNNRMIIESYAFAVHIFNAGEIEADRFQDYAKVQQDRIQNKKKSIKTIQNKYDKDYFKNNGWISDKNKRSISLLVSELANNDYTFYYKLLSEFVHASPFSINSIAVLSGKRYKDEEPYFPLSFENIVNFNLKLIYDFTALIIGSFIKDDAELYLFYMKAIMQWG